MEWGVTHSAVVLATLRLGQQMAVFSVSQRLQKGFPSVALSIWQGLGEGLRAGLGQQQNADDANESAAGKNDVVKKIALLIVQLHDGCSEHAEASAGQDQTHTTPPAGRQRTAS